MTNNSFRPLDEAERRGLIRPDAFSGPSLEALRIEGLIWSLGFGCYLPIDVMPTSWLRAAVLAPMCPRDAVVAGECAFWVFTGGRIPHRAEYAMAKPTSAARYKSGIKVRQTTLQPADSIALGEIRVMTVQRLGLDLALSQPMDQAITMVGVLVAELGFDLIRARVRLAQMIRHPYRTKAGEVFASVLKAHNSTS